MARWILSPLLRKDGGVRALRELAAKTLLTLAVAAALLIGTWGLVSSLRAEAPTARIGEAVEVRGGSLRVDGIIAEHMAPMQSQKIARSGMSMSSMGKVAGILAAIDRGL